MSGFDGINAETAFQALEKIAEALAGVNEEASEMLGCEVGELEFFCAVHVRGQILGVATQEDDPRRIADALGRTGAGIVHILASQGDKSAQEAIGKARRAQQYDQMGFNPPSRN